MKRRSLAAATVLGAGLVLAMGAGASEPHATAHAEDPARPIHPTFPLLDRNGEHVLDSGAAVSPTATCGRCHDTAFIAEHDLHAKISRREPAAGLARLTAAERTSWERADGTFETSHARAGQVEPSPHTLANAPDGPVTAGAVNTSASVQVEVTPSPQNGTVQSLRQASVSTRLPSSQASPSSSTPSPQPSRVSTASASMVVSRASAAPVSSASASEAPASAASGSASTSSAS